ncbi:MAG: hypothetical protein K1W08_15635 [Lachnospiraceae bacterium]|uniref:hypothetical protein n=1 Tax=uncultured Bacteroides sp. TaxID=162156 RepID=UPI00321F8EDF
MKKIFSLTLAIAMLFACATSASATSNVASPDKEIDGTFIFDVLRVSHLVLNQTATSNGTRSWSDYFDTTEEDPTYRVWIDNTGDYPIQVYVKRGSASSSDIMDGPKEIAAGEQGTVELTTDNDGNNPGRRWVVINPIKGNPFEATVRVRIAPSFSELG